MLLHGVQQVASRRALSVVLSKDAHLVRPKGSVWLSRLLRHFGKGRQNQIWFEVVVNTTTQRKGAPCNSKQPIKEPMLTAFVSSSLWSSHLPTLIPNNKKLPSFTDVKLHPSSPHFSLGPTSFLYCTMLAKLKHNHMAFGTADSKSSRHFVSLGHPSMEQMWMLCWIPKEFQGVTKKGGRSTSYGIAELHLLQLRRIAKCSKHLEVTQPSHSI